MAVLVPCLVSLRSEFDELNPTRDRSSDGWISDAPHELRVSDHNDDEVGKVPIHDADSKHEVHALDVDPDGLPMSTIVDSLVARCRAGTENRLRYIIWDHTIWEASNGWRSRDYDGDDPHTGHAHFSASYDSIREADTRPWLKEIELLTDADKKWLSAEIAKVATQVWNHTEDNPESTTEPPEKGRMGGWARMAETRAKARHAELLDRLSA